MRKVLDDEVLAGVQAIDRSLRVNRQGRLVDVGDYGSAVALIDRLCRCWGAVADLLVPVSPAGPTAEPYVELMRHSELDALTTTGEISPVPLMTVFGKLWHPWDYPALLIAASRPKASHHTLYVTNVDPGDPWHLAYTACLGLLGTDQDAALLDGVMARDDLQLEDFIPIERDHCGQPGFNDLRDRLGQTTPVWLSLLGLRPARLRSNFHATDGWLNERDARARDSGSSVVVLYQPGNVADLCLLWNLRALHGFPLDLPIGVPWTGEPENRRLIKESVATPSLQTSITSMGPVLVSASLPQSEIDQLIDELGADNDRVQSARPEEVLVPALAPARPTGDSLVFHDGRALVATRTEQDRELLRIAERLPIKPSLMVKVSLRGAPLPTGPKLAARDAWGPRYPGGGHTTDASRDELCEVWWPQKWTVLRAVAADHALRVEPSAAGKSALALLGHVGDVREIRWLAHRPLLDLLYQTAASSGMTWFKRRATELAATAADAQADPARAYSDFINRIESINVSLDTDTAGLLSFSQVKTALNNLSAAARSWIRWAEARHLIIRGAVLKCDRCGKPTWRPVAELGSPLCPGCGQVIREPFDGSSLTFRFRLAEALRRCIEDDSIYHLLVMRYLVDVTASRPDWLVGAHPGVDLHDDQGRRIGEADVLLVFADATTVPVEVKRHGRGLRQGDVDRLEDLADRLSGAGTILACGDSTGDAGTAFAAWERTEPRPRRLITADQWLAPTAMPELGKSVGDERHPDGADASDPIAAAFDRHFPQEVAETDPIRGEASDAVAQQLGL